MRNRTVGRYGNAVSGNLFLGLIVGLALEWANILYGGSLLVLPTSAGNFRLHHVWVGLLLLSLGVYLKAPFFIGLGAVLMFGDVYEHQRPNGTVAPFW